MPDIRLMNSLIKVGIFQIIKKSNKKQALEMNILNLLKIIKQRLKNLGRELFFLNSLRVENIFSRKYNMKKSKKLEVNCHFSLKGALIL